MPPRIGPRKPVRVYLMLWRKKVGITQEVLGNRIKPAVDKATVSRWESAKPGKLTLGVIAAYAEALDRKVYEMYWMPHQTPSLDALAADLDPDLRQRAADVIESLKGRKAV
jgi:transcriptional regulator with XRE-family HTH domain